MEEAVIVLSLVVGLMAAFLGLMVSWNRALSARIDSLHRDLQSITLLPFTQHLEAAEVAAKVANEVASEEVLRVSSLFVDTDYCYPPDPKDLGA